MNTTNPNSLDARLVCVCSVWVPCVALPSGGGSSVGPSPLYGSPVSPVRVPCVGPLCVGPLCGSPVWVPCVGPSSRCVPCGIYSRDVSRSFTRSRSRLFPSVVLAAGELLAAPAVAIGLGFGLYKIFVYFKADVHELTIIFSPPPTCIAHAGAILLDAYRTVYESPPDLPFVCYTPYNIGDTNIV